VLFDLPMKKSCGPRLAPLALSCGKIVRRERVPSPLATTRDSGGVSDPRSAERSHGRARQRKQVRGAGEDRRRLPPRINRPGGVFQVSSFTF